MSIWFTPDKIFSYNAMLNFCVGARGCGKTYGTKKWAIKRYLKTGEKFIYLRRYKEDLKDIDRFFDTLVNDKELSAHQLTVKGKRFYVDGEECGEALSLSIAQARKSVEYPNTNLIIFDEFIIEKGYQHYLDNEVIKLFNFMDSIFRNRDNCRCLCLANSIVWSNPYFAFFKFLPMEDGFQVVQSGEVLLNVYKNEEFRGMREKTKLAKVTEGTVYKEMAFDNKFEDVTDEFLKQRPKNGYPMVNIFWHKTTYGVWVDLDNYNYVISTTTNKDVATICYTTKDFKNNMMTICDKNSRINKNLKQAFQKGYLYFENMFIRNEMLDLFSLMGLK